MRPKNSRPHNSKRTKKVKYNPSDADPQPLLKEGTYDATLTSALEKVAKKSGANMLVVSVAVFNEETSKDQTVTEFFVDGVPASMRKLKAMCHAVDLDFDGGEVPADMICGQTCRVQVKIQEPRNGYDASNAIAKWDKPDDAPF